MNTPEPLDDMLPYTHWAYFATEERAEACRVELGGQDFLVAIDHTDDGMSIELVPDADSEAGQWLLRAARPVPIDELNASQEHVERIVERHRGFYDGGESGWLDPVTFQPLQQEPDPDSGSQ